MRDNDGGSGDGGSSYKLQFSRRKKHGIKKNRVTTSKTKIMQNKARKREKRSIKKDK